MENYSRTQKYEKLRQQLQNDRESEIKTKELSDYAERLNNLDSRFEKMDVASADHDPLHARSEAYYPDETVVEIPSSEPVKPSEPVEDKFNTDFINEYIKEVKQYNYDKGLRSAEDTQLNILKEVRKGNDPMLRPFGDIETVGAKGKVELPANVIKAIDEQEEMRNTISLEIKSILAEEQASQPVSADPQKEEAVKKEDLVLEEIEEPKDDELDVKKFDSSPESNSQDRITSQDIENIVLNQTREIKAQLNSYENELDDMSSTVTYTNRLLNFVLIILIVALLIVLGIIVYWNLMKRGVI